MSIRCPSRLSFPRWMWILSTSPLVIKSGRTTVLRYLLNDIKKRKSSRDETRTSLTAKGDLYLEVPILGDLWEEEEVPVRREIRTIRYGIFLERAILPQHVGSAPL